jgi:hypothetical protein
VVEVEASTFAQLLFLFSVVEAPAARLLLASPPILRVLLLLLSCGSPRLQRISLRLLRQLLPVMPSPVVDACVSRCTDFPSMPSFLLWRLSRFTLACAQEPWETDGARDLKRAAKEGTDDLADNMDTFGVVGGHSKQALASEVASLLRVLMASSMWGEHVSQAISASLLPMPEILEEFQGEPLEGGAQHTDGVALALAALCAIGGELDCLRVGGRARVAGSGAAVATVVDYVFGRRSALVSFGGTGMQEVLSERLIPVVEVVAPSRVPQAALLAVFKSILGCGASSQGEEEKGQEEAVEQDTKEQEEAVAPWVLQMQWRTLRCLQALFRLPDFAEAAVNSGLVPLLFRQALTPVTGVLTDDGFVDLQALERAARELESWSVSLSAPGGIRLITNTLTCAGGAHSSLVGQVLTPPSLAAIVEVRRRMDNAASLQHRLRGSFKRSLELCRRALEQQEDSMERAERWLRSDEADTMAQALRAAQQHSDVGNVASRWEKAGQMGQSLLGILGQKVSLKLCFLTLELFHDDLNMAVMWLMDTAGMKYVELYSESTTAPSSSLIPDKEDTATSGGGEEWVCGTCTLSNAASEENCTLCDTPKPASAPAAAPTPSAWVCGTCTMDNAWENESCEMCAQARPADAGQSGGKEEKAEAAPPSPPPQAVVAVDLKWDSRPGHLGPDCKVSHQDKEVTRTSSNGLGVQLGNTWYPLRLCVCVCVCVFGCMCVCVCPLRTWCAAVCCVSAATHPCLRSLSCQVGIRSAHRGAAGGVQREQLLLCGPDHKRLCYQQSTEQARLLRHASRWVCVQ